MDIPRNIFEGLPILIVEDDPDSIDVVAHIIQYYGADIYTAANGQIGLEKVAANHPKLILADLSMPIMDGWEMIKHLKASPETADIPIIALTAHAMIGDREKAIAAGCHSYLTKPIKPRSFIYDLVQILVKIPEIELPLG